MTLYQFNCFPYDRQLAAVFDMGAFLATRWEADGAVNLYTLPGGVFVELYYDQFTNSIVRLRSFSSADPLEDHAPYGALPEGLTTNVRL